MKVGQKQNHTKDNGKDVGIGNDVFEEFDRDFAFKKPNAVGEKRDVKDDDKATISNNASGSKGACNDGIAKKCGVVKDETELRLVTEFALVPELIKNKFGEQDDHKHDDYASDEASKKEIGGGLVVFGWKSDKERSWHKDCEEEVGDLAVGFGTNKFLLAKKEA